jgi:AcrR family transcriptional regulator
VSPGGRPATTSPDAWAQAALDEVEQAGVRALSVEAVARRLGVSKGGAYHHFRDRRALLRAALERWERRQVTELLARLAEERDPRARLASALEEAFVALAPTVIVQLLAAAEDPDVAPVLERSTEARLAFLREALLELGAAPQDAEHRAILAYGHYLGFAQLLRHAPGVLATDAGRRAHLQALRDRLLDGLPAG